MSYPRMKQIGVLRRSHFVVGRLGTFEITPDALHMVELVVVSGYALLVGLHRESVQSDGWT
eukprot:jgi/Hompol1/6254/HPOL_004910-RA